MTININIKFINQENLSRTLLLATTLLFCLTLTNCGQKGPLYIMEEQTIQGETTPLNDNSAPTSDSASTNTASINDASTDNISSNKQSDTKNDVKSAEQINEKAD
jgi:predicted small lipoprotein YifL